MFVTIMSGISCGTRNTQKTASKEETKLEASSSSGKVEEKEKETQTQAKTQIQSETKNNIVDESEKAEPIDVTKPMIKTESEKDGIKTTTWENAKVNTQKKTDTSKKTETSNISEISNNSEKLVLSEFSEFDIKEMAKKSNSGKITQADKGFTFSYFCWLILIVVLIFFIIRYARKNTAA